MSDERTLLERVCRIIVEDRTVVSGDECWKEIWEWHTDHETVRFGGGWSTLAAARRIIAMVREDQNAE